MSRRVAVRVDKLTPCMKRSRLTVGMAVDTRSCGGCEPPPSCVFVQTSTATVYLLYLDGSGSVRNPAERHFVLAGVAVFERQIYHMIKSLDDFVSGLGLGPPQDIELHASVMANGRKGVWRGLTRKARLDTIEAGLSVLDRSHWSVEAFAVAVDKASIEPHDPVEWAFEEICNRFNLLLSRLQSRDDTPYRGLVVMDKSVYEDTLQSLATRFREQGTKWGNLRNLAEVPMFVDSAATRLVQLADLLAWAVWRRYEYKDTRYFDAVVGRFDESHGKLHGLVHQKAPDDQCSCPACIPPAPRKRRRRPR